MTEEASPSQEFTVERVADIDRADWSRAVADSANGTLFHELEFLDYHTSGKFDFHNLMVRKGGKIISVIPGALSESAHGLWFLSPSGASVGGPTVSPRAGVEEVVGVVAALQGYANSSGLAGIRVTVPPSAYSFPASDVVAFALGAQGFDLDDSLFCHFLDLSVGRSSYSKTRRYEIRKALDNGVEFGERRIGDLGTFYDILRSSLQRFDARPTHTEEELTDLMSRFPSRVRLFISSKGGKETAGILAFGVTRSVANTFYICERPDSRGDSAVSVLIAHIADALTAEGFRFLDLGPSSHAGYLLNRGVARFKESFGATGFRRETWSWRTEEL